MRIAWSAITQRVRAISGLSGWSQWALWQRRAVKTILAVIGLIVVSAFLYQYVMIVFEDRSPSFGHSLQVVIETYTGTGYGSDSPWESPAANVFVSVMDLSTFLLLFIIVPYVFRPVLENALSPTVPTSVDLSDHIVVCGVDRQTNRLIDELDALDAEYAVIAETEETALELAEQDVPVLFGDPTSAETHRAACVGAAKAVVVNVADHHSVSVVLALREVNESVRTVVVVADLAHERHLRYTGADRVLTPRQLLGGRIAERITTEISVIRSDSITVGEDFSILELSVFETSPIHGNSISEVEATAGETVTVLGMWKAGTFVKSPSPDTVLDETTGLLVAGREPDVQQLERETYQGREIEPTVVIAGYGVVGSTVRDALDSSVAECRVVDVEDGDAIDVVGDVTEEETLTDANLDEATVFVVTIGDDDDAILSVVLANELTEELYIIARLNDSANDTKARRAGADYVLTLPEVSGRVLAQEVLNESILSYGRQLKTVRLAGEPFAGQTLATTTIHHSDCIVVGVERQGELLTDIDSNFEFQQADSILVVGSDAEIAALTT